MTFIAIATPGSGSVPSHFKVAITVACQLVKVYVIICHELNFSVLLLDIINFVQSAM